MHCDTITMEDRRHNANHLYLLVILFPFRLSELDFLMPRSSLVVSLHTNHVPSPYFFLSSGFFNIASMCFLAVSKSHS